MIRSCTVYQQGFKVGVIEVGSVELASLLNDAFYLLAMVGPSLDELNPAAQLFGGVKRYVYCVSTTVQAL